MNRNIGLWVVTGMVSLALFSGPASGVTLLFIDDFGDGNVTNSTPAPADPGGGVIGGAGFWQWGVSGGADGNTGTVTEASGILTITADVSAEGAVTNTARTLYMMSTRHSQLNFIGQPVGEGLLLQVTNISISSTVAGRGYIDILLMPSSNTAHTVFSVAEAAYVRIHTTEYIQFYAKEGVLSSMGTNLFNSSAGGRTLSGFDYYLDVDNYAATVYYTDGSTATQSGAHGIPGMTSSWDQIALQFSLRPAHIDNPVSFSAGGITVTQIPEPGSIGLLGLLGMGLLVRRFRRSSS